MGAYTTVTISRSRAIQFLMGKIMSADNKQLAEMMDVYGDEEPFCLNNFTVVDEPFEREGL